MNGSQPHNLYVFDLDKTLIKGNGSFRFYFFLYSIKFFPIFSLFRSLSYYFRHRFCHMSLKELHRKSFSAFLEGRNWDEILRYVDDFLDRHLDKMLNPKILNHLRNAQKRGGYTLILSSSPAFLVQKIAKRLQVDEWRGTEYQVDKNRKISKILSIILGGEKARHTIATANRLGIDQEGITVYTDSIFDLPLAKIAGRVFAVNPDRRLKCHSKRKGWQIL